MNAIDTKRTWQTDFVRMLPELEQRLARTFRHLDPAAREEAVAEAIALCVRSFVRLHEQGRANDASASTMAFYSARQIRSGRTAAGKLNGKEPLSRYAQVGNGIRVEQDEWIDELVEDRRAPVPDQVAARMDFRLWFERLSQRMRQIAKDLALGCSTSDVARRNGVSAARISQLRRALEASWAAFQQEAAPVLAQ